MAWWLLLVACGGTADPTLLDATCAIPATAGDCVPVGEVADADGVVLSVADLTASGTHAIVGLGLWMDPSGVAAEVEALAAAHPDVHFTVVILEDLANNPPEWQRLDAVRAHWELTVDLVADVEGDVDAAWPRAGGAVLAVVTDGVVQWVGVERDWLDQLDTALSSAP